MKKLLAILMFSSGFVCLAQAAMIEAPVPQTQLTLPSRDLQRPQEMSYLELQASSWSPQHFSQSSQIPNTSDYSSTSPQMSLNFAYQMFTGDAVNISSKIGASFLSLQRTGNMKMDNASYKQTENLHMYQADVGAEVASNKNYFGFVRPVAGLFVLPTWSQAGSSEFSNGISEMNWAAKGSVGVVMNISKLAQVLDLDEVALSVGFERTQSLDGSDLNGNGLWASTRIGWK
jgi:hypothetical protein